MCLVGKAVEHGIAEPCVGEDLRPLREGEVGGDVDGSLFGSLGDDLEEQFGSDFGKRNIAEFIEEGFVIEGLTIVKALRSRYDGRTRNPWNEYECGNYYARAMASYSLLGALAGFRYSAVERTLWFGTRLNISPFKSFFSTAFGFGTITLDDRLLSIRVIEGELPLEKLVLSLGGEVRVLDWKVTVRSDAAAIKSI